MGNKGVILLLLTLVLLVCPVAAMGGEKTDVPQTQAQTDETQTQTDETQAADISEKDSILVLSSSTNKVSEIDLFEYVVGAVAAEMPATYHSQALRAQAVACYTYALKVQENNSDESLNGADISDSSDKHQGYIDKAARKEKWGDKYETYEKKIEEAVAEVLGKKLTFDGELITAAFHAISAGRTFSSLEVWGQEVDYLESVTSAGDKLSPDYSYTVAFTQEQFKKAAEKLDGVKLGDNPKDWVGDIKKTQSGYVESVKIGGKTFTGVQVRKAFELRSAAFEIKYEDENFRITADGYGHGVGMSQYGADYMARQGSTWEEILLHYYKGAKIESD